MARATARRDGAAESAQTGCQCQSVQVHVKLSRPAQRREGPPPARIDEIRTAVALTPPAGKSSGKQRSRRQQETHQRPLIAGRPDAGPGQGAKRQ